MNINALKAKMVFNEISAETLCERIGISQSSFYRKLNGTSEFTQGEISAIAGELKLTRDDVFTIFFADEVS